MLEMRPNCEHCNKPLPPEALDARICSFECTFCASCVELLSNVCPNCAGGFTPRPVRPARNWKGGHSVTTAFRCVGHPENYFEKTLAPVIGAISAITVLLPAVHIISAFCDGAVARRAPNH